VNAGLNNIVDMELIVASSINRVIGLCGALPFICKSDQAFFKAITLGKVCHVGYNTYNSVKNLKGREFVVIDRDRQPFYEQGAVVIGGAKTYEAYMNLGYIDTIYITWVCATTVGDTLLPESLLPINLIKSGEWDESIIVEKPVSDYDQYDIIIYKFTKKIK